jgi:toxin ParE1/3/4
MNQALHRSPFFNEDFDRQYRWYLAEAGEEVAERYYNAVLGTLRELARQPGLGRKRCFRHSELQNLRSFRVEPPFNIHIIFYRTNDRVMTAERVMHGARDLPRRLTEPPGLD